MNLRPRTDGPVYSLLVYQFPGLLHYSQSADEVRSAQSSEVAPQLWWRSLVEDFEEIPSSHLSSCIKFPPGTQTAASFTAICINVPQHLTYLLSSILTAGGKEFKARLPTDGGLTGALESAAALIKDANLPEAGLYVNATGLGAKELVPDDRMYPVKGQTVLVRGEAKGATTTDQNRYVIPRPGSGTTILGGTREVGIWYALPSSALFSSLTRLLPMGC